MYIFKFADIGEGLHEGLVGELLVKVGDQVKDGTNLFIVENEKMTTEISSPVNGIITKIFFKQGDTIHVGQEIFHIDDGSSVEVVPTPVAKPPSTAIEETKIIPKVSQEAPPINTEKKQIIQIQEVAKKDGEEEASSVVGQVQVSNNILPLLGDQVEGYKYNNHSSEQLISPIARKMVNEHHLDIRGIKGSGLNGKIMIADLKLFSDNSLANQGTFGVETHISTETRKKPTPLRNKIAQVMKESWNSVAYTNLAREIDITELWNLRSTINQFYAKKLDAKITFLPYLIKAICLALKDFPIINATYDEKTHEIVYHSEVNIGVAVDTEYGLFVPVIKLANKKSIISLAKEITILANKAKAKKLDLSQMTGGTLTVTNYGSLGAEIGVPVINHPELAIVGLGAIKDSLKRIDGVIVDRKIFNLTVACDHRWIDGAEIARFINLVKDYIENPYPIFMED